MKSWLYTNEIIWPIYAAVERSLLLGDVFQLFLFLKQQQRVHAQREVWGTDLTNSFQPERDKLAEIQFAHHEPKGMKIKGLCYLILRKGKSRRRHESSFSFET